jgi:hypothetical protein
VDFILLPRRLQAMAPPSTPSFLPLLVAPSGSWHNHGVPLFASVFSKTAWEWRAYRDGGGTWLLLSTGRDDDDASSCLVSPLTGAVTARLPRLTDQISRTAGRRVFDGRRLCRRHNLHTYAVHRGGRVPSGRRGVDDRRRTAGDEGSL